MATTVREPLLKCQRDKRCRRKKFVAALLLAVFLLVVFGSIFAYGKSSRKLHKSLHKLEDQVEDLERTYKNSISALNKDLESTKSHLQVPSSANKNTDLRSGEVEKTLSSLQQQLKQAQEEMETQREAMKELVKVFWSYQEETNKEILKLKDAQIKDQEEIERLKTASRDLESQKHQGSKTVETQTMSPKKDDSFSQDNNVQSKKIEPGTVEVKPKSSPNLVVRSARAVKEYVSNLAAKLNPFRSSRDKKPNTPKVPVALEGTLKKSLENVPVEEHHIVKVKDVDNVLENILSILGTSHLDDAEVIRLLRPKFHSLDSVLDDYARNSVGDHDRILKWKKNYTPVKEQFEKIEQENTAHHGSKGHHHHHKHGSKQFQKLANMTRHLKDSFHSLLKQ